MASLCSNEVSVPAKPPYTLTPSVIVNAFVEMPSPLYVPAATQTVGLVAIVLVSDNATFK